MIETADADDLDHVFWYVATQTRLDFAEMTFPQVYCLFDQDRKNRS